MTPVSRVSAPPSKPLVIFDGDCHFCGLWIKRWKQITSGRADYLPYQDTSITARFPEIPQEQFETAVHLIEPDGTVHRAARAALGAIAKNPDWSWPLRIYSSTPFLAKAMEGSYRFVAKHRTFFSRLTRFCWGEHVEAPAHLLTRWFFLRGLGLIYLIAFLSLWTQITGLIGNNGILPVKQFMASATNFYDDHGFGIGRYFELPTFCWISASDGFLNFLCAAGVLLSLLLVVGVAPLVTLILLWMLYLSLSIAGQVFLGFQWDTLLLETGFFAIFFAPRRWLLGLSLEISPSRTSLFLLRWLLFRLMFQSGVTKLLYNDETWLGWTARSFHYETQPLPTWIAWYVHQWPLWLHKFSCGVMYFIEIVLPFFFLAPQRLRFFAAGATLFLQVVIALTGNYTFFNLLTALLCIPLLDDFAVHKLIPPAVRRFFSVNLQRQPSPPVPAWRTAIAITCTAFALVITTTQMFLNFQMNFPGRGPASQLVIAVTPLRTFNSYGLFRVMTHPRYEISIEGSDDGVTWLPYEFKWKPGDVRRRPAFVAPHQPRLDWQMWFAALSEARQNRWFGILCVRLLQGSPQVLALLDKNPFPKNPPRFIRAVRYQYHFTNRLERNLTGDWWKRELPEIYLPTMSRPQPEKPAPVTPPPAKASKPKPKR